MMPKGSSGAKKRLEDAASRAVGAGKQVRMDTVDFSDPNRSKTCLEVDFPILPINQIAAIEGNAGKPIYQMSKWWARRRSSVFRSLLIAAATKAPNDPAQAAKTVWDAYYANHQAKGAFKHLKVADIFMGGGTTLVEG
jgi:adenine-specific DNA methylase